MAMSEPCGAGCLEGIRSMHEPKGFLCHVQHQTGPLSETSHQIGNLRIDRLNNRMSKSYHIEVQTVRINELFTFH